MTSSSKTDFMAVKFDMLDASLTPAEAQQLHIKTQRRWRNEVRLSVMMAIIASIFFSIIAFTVYGLALAGLVGLGTLLLVLLSDGKMS